MVDLCSRLERRVQRFAGASVFARRRVGPIGND